MGDGTVYECFHGGNFVTTNIVLEWKPFERAVSENTYVASTSFIATIDLAPTDGGTRLTWSCNKLRGTPRRRLIGTFVARTGLPRYVRTEMTKLSELIEEDLSEGRVTLPDHTSIAAENVESSAREALRDLNA